MNISPFHPTLPEKPSRAFFQSLRHAPASNVGWQGFRTLENPAIAIYHLQTPLDSYHGIIALTSTKDFIKNRVLPHEKTLVKREKATLLRLQENKGIYKPILLTYKPNEAVDLRSRLFTIENKPNYIYQDEETKSRHLIWLVTDPLEQHLLQQQFKKIKHCYLADGHHRAKSVLRWPSSKNAPDQILTAFFDLNEVRVSPYNRVLLHGLSLVPNFENRLLKYLKIEGEQDEPPKEKGTILVVLNEKRFLCRWRSSLLKKAAKQNSVLLDTYLVNEYLFKKEFGLKKIRSNKSIAYIEGQGGVSNVVRKVAQQPDHVGFCLCPILEKDFIKCSKKSIMLPPKSTWFRPRLTGGLICQRF